MKSYNALSVLCQNKDIVDAITEDQIVKDLDRTFQKFQLFRTKETKSKLLRILKSLVAYDRSNGYTQGMNFLAASFVLHCEESVTFWLCTGLLEKYEIREIYSDGFSGMYKHIRVFEELLEKYLPSIHQQFQDFDVLPEMYLTTWILTFMCSYLPIPWLSKYLNEFFKHSWTSFYAI